MDDGMTAVPLDALKDRGSGESAFAGALHDRRVQRLIPRRSLSPTKIRSSFPVPSTFTG